MCDTIAFPAVNGNTAFFGKNSDREPGEPQFIQYVTVDTVIPDEVEAAGEKPAYIADALPVLQSALDSLRDEGRPTCAALISRPSWMWGAEMGVNEAGVAIGNEAVFSRRRSPGRPLLGMDILRLALHFSGNAADGARLIQDLVARWGQGGDGGWKHKTEYSNSYLVQDRISAWLVETSGSRVRCRRADTPVGISNTYDGAAGWDAWPALKRTDERPLFAIGARGRARNELKRPWLEGSRSMSTVTDMFTLLRTHGGANGSIRRGMGSICIHTGRFIKSETTSSLVVHWHPDGPVAWATGSSWPCRSLYKPYVIGTGNPAITATDDHQTARLLRERRERIGTWANTRPRLFADTALHLRDDTEAEFLKLVYDRGAVPLADAVERCHELEAAYMDHVEAAMC